MSPVAEVEALSIDPKKILVHPRNPRREAVAGEQMVASVREKGVLQPLLLAPIPADLDVKPGKGQEFVLLAGHRRLDAALTAKVKQVPAVVRRDLDTVVAQLETMLEENVHRLDLDVLEEGDLLLELQGEGLSQAQIHKDTGLAKSRISERVRAAKTPTAAREQFKTGQVTLDALLELAKIDDKEQQDRIAAQPPYLWHSEVQRVLAVVRREKELAARRAEYARAGVRLLEEFPPEPSPDGDEQDGVVPWARLEDVFEHAFGSEAVSGAIAKHRGVELSKEFVEGLDWDDLIAWHQETCTGHAVVEEEHRTWAGTSVMFEEICTTPGVHDELITADAEGAASLPATGDRSGGGQAGAAESPEVAARRAHLEARVVEHTAWLFEQVRAGSARLGERAWAAARAQLARLELTEDGQLVNAWQKSDLERRRAFLGLPEGESAATVEEAFHAAADGMDLPQLLVMIELIVHGPAYGTAMMRTPGGFDNGWARDRVKLLHTFGWEWDEQELDEIRQHKHLVQALGLADADADADADANVEGGAA